MKSVYLCRLKAEYLMEQLKLPTRLAICAEPDKIVCRIGERFIETPIDPIDEFEANLRRNLQGALHA